MIRGLLYLYVFLLPSEALLTHVFGVHTTLKPYRVVGLACLFAFLLRAAFQRRRLAFDGYDRVFLFILAWGLSATLVWKAFFGEGAIENTVSDLSLILLNF